MTDSSVVTQRAVHVWSAVPTFLAADVAATARWYAEHLGFRIAGHVPDREPYVYASLQRDEAEIMLLSLPDYRKPDLSSLRPSGLWDAYFRLAGVGSLYEGVRGKSFVKMPLRKQRYGDWEFEVFDPNGYVLTFGGDADLPEDGDR
jgi:catechol 2,3-dioxygenase-like lactoylglutathione lyase family enzyme